jgi:hypothetical protein
MVFYQPFSRFLISLGMVNFIDGLRTYWLGILIDGIIVNLGQGAETSFKFFNAAQRAKYQFL